MTHFKVGIGLSVPFHVGLKFDILNRICCLVLMTLNDKRRGRYHHVLELTRKLFNFCTNQKIEFCTGPLFYGSLFLILFAHLHKSNPRIVVLLCSDYNYYYSKQHELFCLYSGNSTWMWIGPNPTKGHSVGWAGTGGFSFSTQINHNLMWQPLHFGPHSKLISPHYHTRWDKQTMLKKIQTVISCLSILLSYQTRRWWKASFGLCFSPQLAPSGLLTWWLEAPLC